MSPYTISKLSGAGIKSLGDTSLPCATRLTSRVGLGGHTNGLWGGSGSGRAGCADGGTKGILSVLKRFDDAPPPPSSAAPDACYGGYECLKVRRVSPHLR
jgi:hypothetical protein